MQAKQQEMQMLMQAEVSKIGVKMKADMQLEQMRFEHERELAILKLQAHNLDKEADVNDRKEIERMKDDRKDERVKKQAIEQSKLISQRQGQRGELKDEPEEFDLGQALAKQALNK